MTDQQKKAVEEAAENYKYHIVKSSFISGAEEVLDNPEKYGLIEISKVLQGLGLKGDDTCKP